MKKILLFSLFITFNISFATTFHTLPFDSSISFAEDETFATSTDTLTNYCTWDADYLYLAYKAPYLSSQNDTIRSTYDVFWYIDTDPNPENPTLGAGSSQAGTYWTQIMEQQPHWFDEQSWDLPFNADFFVMGAYDRGDSVTYDYGPWDPPSGLWLQIGVDTMHANLSKENGYYEVRVPWDSLGNPEEIFILGFVVSNEWTGEVVGSIPFATRDVGGTLGSWPAQSLVGGDGDKGPNGQFNHWFSFDIQDGLSPTLENDPPQVAAISAQTINEGETFTGFDLDNYVFDDLTPDDEIIWTYTGHLDIQISVDASNMVSISTPNDQWNGIETIVFTATDQGGKSAEASLVLTVNGDNQMPVAENDTTVTIEDIAIEINLLINDSDPDIQDDLKIDQVFPSANSSILITADSTILYTSNLNYFGEDVFEYVLTDRNGGRDTAFVVVNVSALNDPPHAADDAFRTDVNTAITLDVKINDSDPEDDPITIVEALSAANGSIVINGGNDLTYTPNADFHGQDTFRYVINDDKDLRDTALVTLDVNNLPVAVNDQGVVDEDNVLILNLLLNDTDLNLDTLSVLSITEAIHGSVENNNDSTMTYTPQLHFFGSDSVEYIIEDGYGGLDTAKAILTINPVNDAPFAIDDSVRTPRDSAVTISVLDNDWDLEENPLSVIGFSDPLNGQAIINSGLTVTYQPDAEFSGEDSFNYIISDGDKADTAFVFVLVNTNPVAVVDSAIVQEDIAATFNVLTNDSDLNNDPLSVFSFTTPNHGSVENLNGGNLSYTPELNFTGADSFNYHLSDNFGGFDTAMVYLTVTGINDNPVALNDSTSLAEDVLTLLDVLSNDTDPESNLLTIYGFDQAANGTITSNGDTSLNYEPTTNFFGADSFKYRINDGLSGTDSAWVILDVRSVNDAPEIRELPQLVTLNPVDSTKLLMTNYAYDVDTADSLLAWTFEVSDPAISFDFNTDTDSLTIYSHGILAEFNLFTTLSDDSGASALDTIAVRVEEPSGLAFDLDAIPKVFTVSQNFPNPFNPTTQIVYGLPKAGAVKIDIYNTAGQKVYSSSADFKPAGYHFIQLDATEWSTGLYFYRVISGKSVKVKKMMLIK